MRRFTVAKLPTARESAEELAGQSWREELAAVAEARCGARSEDGTRCLGSGPCAQEDGVPCWHLRRVAVARDAGMISYEAWMGAFSEAVTGARAPGGGRFSDSFLVRGMTGGTVSSR